MKQFKPHVSPDVTLPEFTLKAAIAGILLGILFGGANTYLGLRAGLTISTSIPVAVLTVILFKTLSTAFGVRHSILEANMAQTIGSASSSVASGVIFTIPALFLWGMKPELLQLTVLAMCGGLIGVLSMIPLRRFLIQKEHGKLPYPEGVACAQVLVATESKDKSSNAIFWGLGIGMLTKFLVSGFKVVPGAFKIKLPFKAGLAFDVSAALTGVGYILGLRVATIMVAGGALASLIIIPGINLWGADLTAPFYPETKLLIKDMGHMQIWNRYVRYIGAGAVATGGIITLIKSIPLMVESFKVGFANYGDKATATSRTDSDFPLPIAFGIVGVIVLGLTLTPGVLGFIDSVLVRGLASLLIVIFAFFFVTVSSRIVGMVGVSSNPTSGMTIGTLLATSVIFYLFGWTDLAGKATALMVGTGVCIAASIAGDTSQDLKTGFLLGATPRRQQLGELIGVITSAAFVCMTILLLDKAFGLGSAELPAPQATLMNLVITGVLDQNLPWALIAIGVGIALVAHFMKLPVLAFAVGVYLPVVVLTPIFLGGLIHHFIHKGKETPPNDSRLLLCSGFVGGEGLAGVALAGWVAMSGGTKLKGLQLGLPDMVSQGLAVAVIVGLCLIVFKGIGTKKTA